MYLSQNRELLKTQIMVWDVYNKIEEMSGKYRGENLPVDFNSVATECKIQRDILLEYVLGFQILEQLDYDDTTCQMTLRSC
jgi:hypothetical protein